MTKDEALNILRMYENWNTGQTSVPLAFNGTRTLEDDFLDNKRKLLIKAQEVLLLDNKIL